MTNGSLSAGVFHRMFGQLCERAEPPPHRRCTASTLRSHPACWRTRWWRGRARTRVSPVVVAECGSVARGQAAGDSRRGKHRGVARESIVSSTSNPRHSTLNLACCTLRVVRCVLYAYLAVGCTREHHILDHPPRHLVVDRRDGQGDHVRYPRLVLRYLQLTAQHRPYNV